MSRRWYFEATPSGKEQFITVKRHRSHRHHHHYHRHHDPDTYRVGRDEWSRMVERERCLVETSKGLADEACALRASLSSAQADAHHFSSVVIPQLQNQINVLSADNDALRQSVDNAGNTAAQRTWGEDRLWKTIERLEKERNCLERGRVEAEKERCGLEKDKSDLQAENADLRERIKCLSRQYEPGGSRRPSSDSPQDAEYWRGQCLYWKSKFEDTRRRHDDTCGVLEIRTEKMKAYEEILKRRRII
ncbi:hypothetical protein CDD83_10526 [Cordyceps sp. RAO-2017]|nr:hypothetical protein CDD83_10526 [Cordyceps sp. RAO-2017]